MPIGVPKVPFQLPGEEDAVWVDMYTRLFRERLLFLGQRIRRKNSNLLIGLMIYLSGEDATQDLFLFINSHGGSVTDGLAIYNVMMTIKPDVNTVCIGLAASMASLLLAGGEITKRIAFPHARVMIHQPSTSFRKSEISEIPLDAEELLTLRKTLTRIYAQRTGTPYSVISVDMERDTYMSAEEAKAYGIVDFVGKQV
uniref:clp protease proteolytic subunit n=1 Tax=Xyris indica TaxID=2919641 RepID=UPI001F147A74|nr:clp protease proteolytic subunit [Xyris indica]ULQ68347.1 clp protease proteolytic subunit [Xyris indica]ULQ68427.1 clp protease proteolytic subunit [Xyris indica]ULQ68664.1 clp protease proteolytic subunit [Xyris indica]